jgi:hypothetical protein
MQLVLNCMSDDVAGYWSVIDDSHNDLPPIAEGSINASSHVRMKFLIGLEVSSSYSINRSPAVR